VALRVREPAQRFAELLRRMTERGPRPVVLIDEYDKPVLQVLESPVMRPSWRRTSGSALRVDGGVVRAIA
jgi:hypothetical protein